MVWMVFMSSPLLYFIFSCHLLADILLFFQNFIDPPGFSIFSLVIRVMLINISSLGERFPWATFPWAIPKAILGVLVPFPLGGEGPVAYRPLLAQIGTEAQSIDKAEVEG